MDGSAFQADEAGSSAAARFLPQASGGGAPGGGGHLILLSLVGWPILMAALLPEPRALLPPLPSPSEGAYTVLLADWGLHTAIVVEQPPGWRLGPPGAETAAFLEYAWGDRRYFSGADRGPTAVLAALFLPTEAALFLAGHADPPDLAGTARVLERRVDAPTLHALLTSLERSLPRGPAGERPTPLPRRSARGGHFYPALGTYHWSRNCNLWTVRRLREAGMALHPAGVVFTLQVPRRLLGFRPRRLRQSDSVPGRYILHG